MSKKGGSGINNLGMGAGLVGVFGSTTRNSCPSDDTSIFCQISRVLAIIGSLLSIIITLLIIYMLLQSFGFIGGSRNGRGRGTRRK
ncbi:MAG: hypothetical protein CMD14_09475 [Flavobacteriales bacterium]|nr:hypothetical protein [Flavobacteriales bacterium]|tara:strand:- start:11148 stop:11405 length:258 start_codon:yes stop_codon:yes gene_type:complete